MDTGDPEDGQVPLSEIIERLNERFCADFTEGERLFLRQVQEDVTRCLNDPDFQEVVFTGLLRAIFDKVMAQEPLGFSAPTGEPDVC